MGLGPNLTLETAINPDFGQVEADPAEVNLTAFETRFPEKRPFFVEGAQLFNIGHPNFYYSRRIGARPIGPATGDYVDYPDSEHDHRRRQADRPPAVEDVDRLHRRRHRRRRRAELRAPGIGDPRTVAGRRRMPITSSAACCRSSGRPPRPPACIVNYVHRDFDEGSPLADLYTRNALGVAGNTLLRFKGGEYEFRASAAARSSTAARRRSSACSDRARTTRSVPIATIRRSIRR